MKKTKKSSKSNMAIFSENPFLLATAVFISAIIINLFLEQNFTKDFFNWCGYYFNYTIYWLNSIIQPTFKNHPYIHIPVITNPITAQLMTTITPWMWLRGFLISSFTISHIITLLQIEIIQSKNIIIASILIAIFQLIYYVFLSNPHFTVALFIHTAQKHFIDILALIFVTIVGLLLGIEYSVYLYRNEKIQVKSTRNGPDIQIKYNDNWK